MISRGMIVGLAALILAACTDPPGAQRILAGAGYTDIRIDGHAYFFSGCSEQDSWRTKFTARGPNGQVVRGVVCQGAFGPATIRLW